MSATALVQTAALGKRAVVRTARQPANVVFPLVFPMLLLAVNAGGLKAESASELGVRAFVIAS